MGNRRVCFRVTNGNMYAFSKGLANNQQNESRPVQSVVMGANNRVFYLGEYGNLYAFSEGLRIIRVGGEMHAMVLAGPVSWAPLPVAGITTQRPRRRVHDAEITTLSVVQLTDEIMNNVAVDIR